MFVLSRSASKASAALRRGGRIAGERGRFTRRQGRKCVRSRPGSHL